MIGGTQGQWRLEGSGRETDWIPTGKQRKEGDDGGCIPADFRGANHRKVRTRAQPVHAAAQEDELEGGQQGCGADVPKACMLWQRENSQASSLLRTW